MREVDIENGLYAQLAAAGMAIPIAWPNQDYTGQRPYLEVSLTGGKRRGGSLKGGQITYSKGILAVVAVTQVDDSTQSGSEYAELVADAFAEGLRINITGGQIVIWKPTDVIKGYKDENDWRTPAVVHYEAKAS
jgi:hypothetical protein